jgi:hypothetical protein
MRHYQVAGVGLLAGALALALGDEGASAAEHHQAGPPAGPASQAAPQQKAAGAPRAGAPCPCEEATEGATSHGGAGAPAEGELSGLPGWSPSLVATPRGGAPGARGFGAGLADHGSFALGPVEAGACGGGATGAGARGPGGAAGAGGASFGAGIGGAGGRASEAPFKSPFMLGPLPSEGGGQCAACPGERRP